MSDISNKTFGMLIGIALFVSAVGMFSIPGNDFFSFVGFATTSNGSGQVKINVTALISLNLTRAMIDFGNGTVSSAATNCTLSSNRIGLNSSIPAKCFPATWGNTGAGNGGFSMENIGNVMLNVSVRAYKNGSIRTGTRSFWGTKSQDGKYMYKCFGNGTEPTLIATFIPVRNNSVLCEGRVPVFPSNRFVVDINITIPKNSTGYHNDTLTFVGSRACSSDC